MAGMKTYTVLKQIEEKANDLGFNLAFPSYDYEDAVALVPLGEKLPVYSRDAEVFRGSFQELDAFLRGVTWTQTYYRLTRACDDKRLKEYEEKYVAQMAKIKYNKEKRETFDTLKKEHV
jgi:hypothetical protein